MGVTCVVPFPIVEGKSGPHVLETLEKQVELLGATRAGNFCVDCETYQSNTPPNTPQRLVHVFTNTEHPASCFAVLDTGTCLVADMLFTFLMQKVKDIYRKCKPSKIECRGQRYAFSDFIIKVGAVSMASNFRGIIIEIEYRPCIIPSDCWELMKELLATIMGKTVENAPAYLKTRMDVEYSPTDTIQQYLEHFNGFRKATQLQMQQQPQQTQPQSQYS